MIIITRYREGTYVQLFLRHVPSHAMTVVTNSSSDPVSPLQYVVTIEHVLLLPEDKLLGKKSLHERAIATHVHAHAPFCTYRINCTIDVHHPNKQLGSPPHMHLMDSDCQEVV